MTHAEITKRLRQIAKASNNDPERAHLIEDALFFDFIQYVAQADNSPAMRELAALVLTADDIDFPRWCA